MKKSNFSLLLFCFIVCLCFDTTAQTMSPVKVTVWGRHYGGQVSYKYQVQNLGNHPIDRLFIGFYPPSATAEGAAELTVPPYYPEGVTSWLPPRVSESPSGWGVNLSYPEESATFCLDWIEAAHYRKMRPKADSPDIPVPQNPPNIMPPGAIWKQFSVTIPSSDFAYVTGHAYLFYGDSELTIQIEKGDTAPPALTVTLTPSILTAAQYDKLVPIAVQITAKDDYDPLPDIKLVSITANEPLEKEDVRALIGTDSRSFSLRAEHNEKNKFPRIYTVTYSATDASGNTAIASATVTVQREQEDKNRAEQHAAPQQYRPTGGAGVSPF